MLRALVLVSVICLSAVAHAKDCCKPKSSAGSKAFVKCPCAEGKCPCLKARGKCPVKDHAAHFKAQEEQVLQLEKKVARLERELNALREWGKKMAEHVDRTSR